MSRRNGNTSMIEALGDLRADYDASKTNRWRRKRAGVGTTGRPADYHYRTEGSFLGMMELSRDFDRNDLVVGQGIDRVIDNVIQTGYTLEPRTGDKGLDKALAARWTDWAEDPEQCDVEGEETFFDFETRVPRSLIVDGDLFCLPLYEGPLKFHEGHRCRTPRRTVRNVSHGILLDEDRRRLEYWFTKEDINPLGSVEKVGQMTRIPARDRDGEKQVFHIRHSKRWQQTRGLTALAPIADTVGMHGDVQFSRMVQQLGASMWVMFRQMELGADMGGDLPQYGNQQTETLADGSTRLIDGISPGMEIQSRPGEKLELASAAVPNPEFFPYATLLLTFIAINLGLPVAVLLLDPSNTNFSGWRGSMDQARQGFRRFQKRLRTKFHSPVYKVKVRHFMAEDPAMRRADEKSKVKIFKHRFNPPAWPYIEPYKDAMATVVRTANGQISRSRAGAEIGIIWDNESPKICRDNARHIKRAQKWADKLNKQFPNLRVTWRDVAALPMAEGVQISVKAADDQADAAQPEPKPEPKPKPEPGGGKPRETSSNAA